MSARMVTEIVRNEFKVNLCPRTIQKKVKDGAVGVSPLRRGPKGFIPEHHFNNLCIAFETFLRINQMNGNTRVLATKRVRPLTAQSDLRNRR